MHPRFPLPSRPSHGRSQRPAVSSRRKPCRQGFPALLLATFIALALSAAARAQAPTLTHLYPVAAQQGATSTIAIVGKATPWPPQVWIDTPGITFKPAAKPPNIDVEISKDAALGPHFIRLYNDKGASAPRYLIVSRDSELKETEPNDRFSAPQKIDALPVTISGRLDKGEDVDSFQVTLKKGQTLVASVEAYVLGSSIDPVLRIVDARGAQLAFNHDGATLDPFLAWPVPADGQYIVQVYGFAYPATSAVSFSGSENAVYRLHLTNGPFVHHTEPLVGEGKPVGFNLPPNFKPADPAKPSDRPELIEQGTAQSIPVPGAVTGHIGAPNEEDRYTLTAQKGKIYELKVTAAAAGSPLDAWLKIEGPGAKELARNDDAGISRDPQLTWTAPADGPVTIVIGDVTHHGSSEHFYRLAINEAVPTAEGTIAANAFTIAAGKTTDLKVTVKRQFKFAKKLELLAKNLPEGVTAQALPVPDKDGDVTLKLTATPEAKPANQPFQLALHEVDSPTEYAVTNLLTTTAENNGVPNGFTTLVIPAITDLWLTVTAK